MRVVIFHMYTIKRNIYTRLTDGIHPLHHVEIEITKEYHHSKVKSSLPLCVTVINDKKNGGEKTETDDGSQGLEAISTMKQQFL